MLFLSVYFVIYELYVGKYFQYINSYLLVYKSFKSLPVRLRILNKCSFQLQCYCNLVCYDLVFINVNCNGFARYFYIEENHLLLFVTPNSCLYEVVNNVYNVSRVVHALLLL